MRIDNATIPTEIIVTQAQEDYERLSYDDKLALDRFMKAVKSHVNGRGHDIGEKGLLELAFKMASWMRSQKRLLE